MTHILDNIDIIVATMHQKEQAMQPAFSEIFGAKLVAAPQFDTDAFGTFTGEKERVLSQYDTLILKARTASQQFAYQYALASEGSFGPHPSFPFVASGCEMLAFYDRDHDMTIVESTLSTTTNYAHLPLTASDDYLPFLEKIGFGRHGLVIRELNSNHILAKGVTCLSALSATLQQAFNHHERLQLETDMRAMFNPTRMGVIKDLAYQLAQRLKQNCPACNWYGFGKRSTVGRLPCRDCETPSMLYAHERLSCVMCDHVEKQLRKDGVQYAEPQYCPECNP